MTRFLHSTAALALIVGLGAPAALAQGGDEPASGPRLPADQVTGEAEIQQALEEERRAAEEAERRALEERRAAEEAERRALEEERRAAEEAERRALEEERRAAEEERRAARRAAAAAGAEDAEPADVIRDVITEDNVCRSDEEFATQIKKGEQIRRPADDDDGLSGAGKAVLFGLGALAVSQLLDRDDEVVAQSDDRLVVRRDGELSVVKDDDSLVRRPGDDVRTERFNDGSTRTTVTRPDGTRIVTIRAGDGTVLRRTRVMPDGREYVLFDDTRDIAPVETDRLPETRTAAAGGDAALRRALEAELYGDVNRSFSLEQVRQIASLRELAPQIEVDQITFATGSAAIRPGQAQELADLGQALQRELRENPGTVLLVEGHTDAVGDAAYNLALSDRRAESVALALTEYFDIPPENMIVQGYGERHLKVATQTAEPANRRAVVRNITPLLR